MSEVMKRLNFYLKLYTNDPKSKACPYANARGILVNVMGKSNEEAHDIIEAGVEE